MQQDFLLLFQSPPASEKLLLGVWEASEPEWGYDGKKSLKLPPSCRDGSTFCSLKGCLGA